MSPSFIIRLLFNSFKTSLKSFVSDGALGWIKMETGNNPFSSSTIVTLKPMKWPFVVE